MPNIAINHPVTGRHRSAWRVALVVVLLFAGLAGSPALQQVEGRLVALSAHFAVPVPASRRVVVVDTREPIADAKAISQLAQRLAKARAIGVVGLPGQLPAEVLALPLVQTVPFATGSLRPALPISDGMLRWAGDTVMRQNFPFSLPGALTGKPPAIARFEPFETPPRGAVAPADFAPSIAPVFQVPLVHDYQGDWLPGFALRMLAAGYHFELTADRLKSGAVHTDIGIIPTDHAYRVFPRLTAVRVPVVTLAEVAEGQVNLRGKLVLLGSTDLGQAEPVALAAGENEPQVVAEGRLLAALIDRAVYKLPSWGLWVHLLAFVGVLLLLALVLPRLRAATAAVLVLLCLFIFATAEFGFVALQATFVPLLAPAAALITGALLLGLLRRRNHRFELMAADLGATNRLLAEAYHAQGQFDAAFERYRRGTWDEAGIERLYGLGMDFERRRQFAKACAVFEHLQTVAPGFRDSEERLKRSREADSRMVLGKSGSMTASGTMILDNVGLARPTIGRYELERELGRGAMGLVYLGRDPRINRTVAIKTMALSEEFEGQELGAVRERFFREAETAGRLDHPNIVTIYDVGEEQDLAYIAMDYLKGESLASWCRPDNLLSSDEVLRIGVQVAEALDYAHLQGVIHRDIKPANIIYDRAEKVVKVTDFGVACLTDSSKTRTGTVLGSPSYMSPEQVAGFKVDGRSDLFSLGITLYQLLTGELPFKADSLPSLMYQIANERHTDIRKYRDCPSCVSRLINKALQKDAAKRFQRGSLMAEALRRCLKEDAA